MPKKTESAQPSKHWKAGQIYQNTISGEKIVVVEILSSKRDPRSGPVIHNILMIRGNGELENWTWLETWEVDGFEEVE